MEKDNRSHSKRSRMRAYKKNHYQKISHNLNSSPIEIGLIDVADSSDDRFSCRSSQWSRRSPASDIDDELDSSEQIGGDFEILQKMPTAGGSGHFQFSSEKNWENDDANFYDKSAANEYFTLNLQLLNAGLQTIPFYKRMDYPGIFNKSDINIMNQEAELAETHYQEVLKEHEKGIKNKPSSGTKRNTSAKSTKSDKNSVITPAAVEESLNVQNETKDADLDELLNLTTNNVAKVSFKDGENPTESIVNPEDPSPNEDSKIEEQKDESKNNEIGNKEDIQQWLDDILD